MMTDLVMTDLVMIDLVMIDSEFSRRHLTER